MPNYLLTYKDGTEAIFEASCYEDARQISMSESQRSKQATIFEQTDLAPGKYIADMYYPTTSPMTRESIGWVTFSDARLKALPSPGDTDDDRGMVLVAMGMASLLGFMMGVAAMSIF